MTIAEIITTLKEGKEETVLTLDKASADKLLQVLESVERAEQAASDARWAEDAQLQRDRQNYRGDGGW